LTWFTDSEDEIVPPSTPPTGDIVPMETSEDTESEAKLLREIESIKLSWEESRELAKMKGKRIVACGKVRRTTKRTQVEMRASPERPSREPESSSYPHDGEIDSTKKTGGFYDTVLAMIGGISNLRVAGFAYLHFFYSVELLFSK
jgi:hypothetical protein